MVAQLERNHPSRHLAVVLGDARRSGFRRFGASRNAGLTIAPLLLALLLSG
jgi:hypothetical protein